MIEFVVLQLGKTVAYIYDAAGNMTSKKTYALTAAASALPAAAESTVNFTYDTTWRDKMTAFGNKTITYDAIGNPTKYGDWNMSWTQGRRLASMSTAGGDSLTFAYNEAGIRTKKVDGKAGLTYQYQLAGSKVVGERVTNTSNGSLVYANQYIYDSAGNIVSMVYNGTEYYYVKNGQGDIIALVDGAGSVVVNYSYDSWGKMLGVTGNTTLGNRNPFRYRGYYYDVENGLYYLNSRYYNPESCRFINMDCLLTGTNGIGCNVFVYCNNNPVRYSDCFGKACEDAMGYGNPEVAKACMREYRRQQWENLAVKVNEIKGKINEDIENFDINNPYTTKVLRANYFSAYNGHLVLRLDWQRSGSFGIMVVKTSLKNNMNGRNEVRHEYGHTVQLDQLGAFKYLLFIGIPSAANWFGDDYYSRPQEVTADLFGNASNPHPVPYAEEIGIIYFGWVKSLLPR